MSDRSLIDFNFWPAFADLMLATVLVLVLIIFLIGFSMRLGTLGIEQVQDRQETVVRELAQAYGDSLEVRAVNEKYVIWRAGQEEVEIQNDIQLQRITFSDNVLFETNDYALRARGIEVLSELGASLQRQMDEIYKITIEGHTDNRPTRTYAGGNLELGARRSMAVYEFLVDEVGFDPARNLMSATSYGHYKPVGRADTDMMSARRIEELNREVQDRDRNRRIELLLFYRRD